MRVLFVHPNFPGQYRHLAQHLRAEGGHELVALTLASNGQPELIRTARYEAPPPAKGEIDPLARHYAQAAGRGHAAAKAALALQRTGFSPDIILGHAGWGDTLFLRDVYPEARGQAYAEFYYNAAGADVGFDPEWPGDDFPARALTHTKNAAMLLGLFSADRGLSPTRWQRSVFPPEAQERIDVAHDGIDTDAVRPNPHAFIRLQRRGLTFRPGDEIITFVNRNLEPYRGYHVFMRALPAILAARPRAHAVIVGGEGVSYGRAAPEGRTWKAIFLDEVRDRLDLGRVHFTGKVPYPTYLNLLQVSAAHVYLTYPFVLSWSMLEAMAAECLVVASGTAPVREVIRDGENGVLFDFFDVAGLGERVVAALAEPERFRALRRAARETITGRYDLRRCCLPEQLRLLERLRA